MRLVLILLPFLLLALWSADALRTLAQALGGA